MMMQDLDAPAAGTRRKRHELESLILEMGRQLIAEQGLGTGAEHLSFKAVFDQLEVRQSVRVTNASVIGRIWDSQEDFQRAVLRSVAAGDALDLSPTVDCVMAVIAAADLSSVEGRRRALMDACRLGSAATSESMRSSTGWSTWLALWSLHAAEGSDKSDPEIATLLRSTAARTAEQVAELASSAFDALGFDFAPGLDLTVVTAAIGSFTHGAFLNADSYDAPARGLPMPTGPNGDVEDWTLMGIGIHSIVERCCVPAAEKSAP